MKVSSDASKDGIGAALPQEADGQWMPVTYASRSMTAAECNYAQIEKEQLGVVFACERFHSYTYGRNLSYATFVEDMTVVNANEEPEMSCTGLT